MEATASATACGIVTDTVAPGAAYSPVECQPRLCTSNTDTVCVAATAPCVGQPG